jgi:predicted transcriptional regulator
MNDLRDFVLKARGCWRRRNAMATSAPTPAVNQNDHVAAAAYLMKHTGASALVVLDGQCPGQPIGIITKAGIARAAAAGEDLNDMRIRDVMPGGRRSMR